MEKKQGFFWFFKITLVLFFFGTCSLVAVASGAFWHFSKDLPNIITVADYHPWLVTRVFANLNEKTPELVGEFSIQKRYIVPYEKIPEHVIKAFISAEDDRFFEHSGINIISMIRASIANFKAGHVVQGGSTITQQVAKSLLLSSEKSFGRKIKEVMLAWKIEKNLTKEQILFLYLNQIYLGHGAYGVQAASEAYFNKDVTKLTLAEAAILAGMPQAPGKYSPLLNPKRAKERQLYVLKRMLENQFINSAQMTSAAAQEIPVYEDQDVTKKYSTYYLDHVRKYLIEKYGEDAVFKEGLTVFIPTTPQLLLSGRESLRRGLEAVDKRIGYRGPIQTLKDQKEIEAFLKKERLELIDKRLGFKVLLPDGKIDRIAGLKMKSILTDAQLLDPRELYQAVVISIDDLKKNVRVMIGGAPADLPLEKIKWAKKT